jgi:hypothetical protein
MKRGTFVQRLLLPIDQVRHHVLGVVFRSNNRLLPAILPEIPPIWRGCHLQEEPVRAGCLPLETW